MTPGRWVRIIERRRRVAARAAYRPVLRFLTREADAVFAAVDVVDLEDLPAAHLVAWSGLTPEFEDVLTAYAYTAARSTFPLAQSVKADPDLPVRVSREIRATIGERVAGIGERSRRKISVLVADGIERGLDPDLVGEAIRSLFRRPSLRKRARSIAQSEMTTAANAGLHAGALESREPLDKVWTTVADDKVRDSHSLANGQRVPVGESFVVGGALLRYPGDPWGPAAETVNCRCVERFVRVRR